MSQSNDSAVIVQEVLAPWAPTLNENYLFLSSFTLAIYEVLLTLPLEIKEIWPARFSVTKALYLLNRYSFLIFQVAETIFFFLKTGNTGCNIINYLVDASTILPSLAIVLIFTLRTYALYNRSWPILVLLVLPGLGIIVTQLWFAITTASARTTFQGGPFTCFTIEANAGQQCKLFPGTMSNVALNVAFDLLVLVLTVFRTARLAIAARKNDIRNSLVSMIFRDGLLYYIIIMGPAILQAIFIALAQKNENLLYVLSDFGEVYNVLQWLMVNRLVLNLTSSVNSRGEEFQTLSVAQEPVFATNSILGNIGAPLNADDEVEDSCEPHSETGSQTKQINEHQEELGRTSGAAN